MRRLALTLALPLLLTACSSSDHQSPPQPTFSPAPVVTASPTPSPTPSATPSPTPLACVCAIPAKDRDVDGDGTPDAIRATGTRLTVVLSSTGATVSAPIHAESPAAAPILGTADVDRDGRAEVFVETAEGASTQFVTPYRFDGKVLRELQLDGGPARLGIGGSVTHGDGFRCPSGQLEVLSSDSTDGSTYTVHVSDYRLSRSALVLTRTRTVTAKQGDSLVDASYRPDCGSVGEGG